MSCWSMVLRVDRPISSNDGSFNTSSVLFSIIYWNEMNKLPQYLMFSPSLQSTNIFLSIGSPPYTTFGLGSYKLLRITILQIIKQFFLHKLNGEVMFHGPSPKNTVGHKSTLYDILVVDMSSYSFPRLEECIRVNMFTPCSTGGLDYPSCLSQLSLGSSGRCGTLTTFNPSNL